VPVNGSLHHLTLLISCRASGEPGVVDMKHKCMLFGLLLAAFTQLAVAEEVAPDWMAESRALTAQMGSELKAELTRAMTEGGPVGAIDVCRKRAPEIAARLSKESGAVVRRTALKVRNPVNAADELEHMVLRQFALEMTSGGFQGPLEAAFEINRGGAKERRYMKAIPTEAVCLGCHGESLAPELAAAIAREYPQDRATGFQIGSLRGAFSVIWPVVGLND
jgi:hypothetical protein